MFIRLLTVPALTDGQTDRIGKIIPRPASIGMLTHNKNGP